MTQVKQGETAGLPGGLEKLKAQLKGTFQTTSLDVWNLYKETIRTVEVSYYSGREEAFNEIMKYLVMQNRNSDFRYVPIKEFISYIESRYASHRIECEARNQALHQAEQSRRLQVTSAAATTAQNSVKANLHLERASQEVQTALDSLAKQAKIVAEEQGPLGSVQSRLAKLSFDIFKVKGTKKRRHPTDHSASVGVLNFTDRSSSEINQARAPTDLVGSQPQTTSLIRGAGQFGCASGQSFGQISDECKRTQCLEGKRLKTNSSQIDVEADITLTAHQTGLNANNASSSFAFPASLRTIPSYDSSLYPPMVSKSGSEGAGQVTSGTLGGPKYDFSAYMRK